MTLKERLKEHVFAKFREGVTLRDNDLMRMALDMNKEFGLVPGFRASRSWITRFKRSSGICSRRITSFVTRKTHVDRAKIEAAAGEFVDDVRRAMSTMSLGQFVNCDQSGFAKELHCPRSLARRGVRTVERLVQSVAATTHSYTILPMHFADGRLGTHLFLLLQEPGGRFPKKGHFQAQNLVVRAGTSHIMTKAHMIDWIETCVVPNMPQTLVLVVDSWPSFRDHATIESLAPPGKKIIVKNIPAGATAMVQPCDVFFFRQFKGMVKNITAHVLAYDIAFDVHQRDNIIKVVSLVYRQFCSPRFEKYLRFPWHLAGYVDTHPGQFQTPLDTCFPTGPTPCGESGCCSSSFIFCAFCARSFCFHHFVIAYHWC